MPRNWLLERSSCSKCANFPSSFGIWPLSWLSLSPRYSKASRLPSSPDSRPVRPAPTRRRFVTSPCPSHQVNFRSQASVPSASAKPRVRSTRTSTWRLDGKSENLLAGQKSSPQKIPWCNHPPKIFITYPTLETLQNNVACCWLVWQKNWVRCV